MKFYYKITLNLDNEIYTKFVCKSSFNEFVCASRKGLPRKPTVHWAAHAMLESIQLRFDFIE